MIENKYRKYLSVGISAATREIIETQKITKSAVLADKTTKGNLICTVSNTKLGK